LLRITVASAMFGKKWELTKEAAAKLIGYPRELEVFPEEARRAPEILRRLEPKQQQLQRCMEANDPHLGYISRPLNGIWATAPYLHNGSVPTIFDLLQPTAKRPPSFNVGTREYDPKNFGYVTTPNAENQFKFETRDPNGELLDGNSNAGHDYSNNTFTDDDRYSLIEYLKTL